MRAILIDPRNKIVEVMQTSGNLHKDDFFPGIYDLLEVNCIDIVRLPLTKEVMYVDDEGLLKPNYFFELLGCVQPIGGKALILGDDSEGGSIGSVISAYGLKKLVKFLGGPLDLSHLAGFRVIEIGKEKIT